MSSSKIALYAGDALGPNDICQNITDFENSGFNTLILGLFHIGRSDAPGPKNVGDIIFNDGLTVVHDGVYQFDSSWNTELQLLKDSGKVDHIYCSIGGASNVIFDFRTIQLLIDGPPKGQPKNPYVTYGTGPNSTLYKNFSALRKAMPAVDGIDMDNEETFAVSTDTMQKFCVMLIELGFKITYCPFTDQSYWNECFYALYQYDQTAVEWWNLQCYAGGGGNDPFTWASSLNQYMQSKGVEHFNGIDYIVPGLFARHYVIPQQGQPYWSGSCPSAMKSQFSSWMSEGNGLNSGFVWQYSDILNTEQRSGSGCDGSNTTADYAEEIKAGLGLSVNA